MVPADGAAVLHKAPIIDRRRTTPSEEKAIQLSQIVPRHIKTDDGGATSRPLSFHVSPFMCLVKSRRRVKASAKVLENATDGFIDRVKLDPRGSEYLTPRRGGARNDQDFASFCANLAPQPADPKPVMRSSQTFCMASRAGAR